MPSLLRPHGRPEGSRAQGCDGAGESATLAPVKRLILSIALPATVLLAGCSSLVDARVDTTHLEGDVPSGLGRDLEVHISGAAPGVAKAFCAALRREFVGRDLFDTVAVIGSGTQGRVAPGASLTVRWVLRSYEDVYDLYEFQGGYAVRQVMEVELRDADDALVLAGTVSGVALDDVSDGDYMIESKREDIRLAAIHDAATKISHGLRRTVFERQTEALRALPEIGLPTGMAPLQVSVLGFDDAENAPRLRGILFSDLLTDTMIRRGSDFDVTPYDRTQRAVGREPPKSFFEIADYEVGLIGQHLTARVFVVGHIQLVGGRAKAKAKLLTRKGKLLGTAEAEAEGLGALPVVAVRLADALGVRLQTVDLPPEAGRE